MELLLGVWIPILDLGEFGWPILRVRADKVPCSESASTSWTTAGVVLLSGVGQIVPQGGLGLAGGSET